MKILIHSLTFPPDQVSTAYLYGDLAERFVKEGWQVEVFTSTPHYNYAEDFSKCSSNRILYRFTEFQGAKVYHIFQSRGYGLFARAFLLMWFHCAFVVRVLCGPRVDVIITPSPPLTSGFISAICAKLRGAKSIYNVQEIYPDILLKTVPTFPLSIYSALKRIETATYKYSDAIVAIDPVFASVLKPRMSESKLSIIPNFVDVGFYKPLDVKDEGKRLGKDFVVAYFGNLGKMQNWDVLVEAMDLLSSHNDIKLLIVGGGTEYNYLSEMAQARKNIDVLGYVSRAEIPQMISNTDVHVISMNEASDMDGLPSKALTILACGKPLIVATSEGSPLACLIRDCKNGIRVDRDNARQIAQAILDIRLDSFEHLSSQDGIDYIHRNFSKEAITHKYVELVKEVCYTRPV